MPPIGSSSTDSRRATSIGSSGARRRQNLPVQAPTKYDLTLNLKTAGALGITIARPRRRSDRVTILSQLILLQMLRSASVQVFRRLDEDLSASADSRRLKSAKVHDPDDLDDATTLVRVNCRASKSVGSAPTLKQSDPKLSSAIQLPLQFSNFLQAPSRHLILCWHQRRPRVV